jgi:hypothetical protein
MSALCWKRDPKFAWHTAYRPYGPNCDFGEYRIWQDPDSRFRVHELSWRHIGEAGTFDQAKAIAQTHADKSREEPAEVA